MSLTRGVLRASASSPPALKVGSSPPKPQPKQAEADDRTSVDALVLFTCPCSHTLLMAACALLEEPAAEV